MCRARRWLDEVRQSLLVCKSAIPHYSLIPLHSVMKIAMDFASLRTDPMPTRDVTALMCHR